MVEAVAQLMATPAAQLFTLIIVMLLFGAMSTAALFGRKLLGIFENKVTGLMSKFDEAVDEQQKTNLEMVRLRNDLNWVKKSQDDYQQRTDARFQAIEQRDRG